MTEATRQENKSDDGERRRHREYPDADGSKLSPGSHIIGGKRFYVTPSGKLLQD